MILLCSIISSIMMKIHLSVLDVMCQSAKKLTHHLKCERDIGNREQVIERLGTNCSICGFNFAETYGLDIARDFIDIHYIGGDIPESQIDPARDFIPICTNCHRMLHKNRSGNMTWKDLKKRVAYYQKQPDFEQLSLKFD